MRKFLSILILISLVLTNSAPVFAQDDAPPDAVGTTIFLPMVDSAAAESEVAPLPDPPVPLPNPPVVGPKPMPPAPEEPSPTSHLSQAERDEAAARAIQQGALNPLMIKSPDAVSAAALTNGAPHYFSHPNYANSPLPTLLASGEVSVGNALQDRQYATDVATEVFVILSGAPLPDGYLTSFKTWNQASAATGPVSAGFKFHAYVLRPAGPANPNIYSVVFDSGLLTVPSLANPSVSELVTFGVANLAIKAGDLLAFYGQGIPLDVATGTDSIRVAAVPAPPLQGSVFEFGGAVYPYDYTPRTYSFAADVIDPQNLVVGGGTSIVAEWNAIAQDIVQPPSMGGMPMSQMSMSAAFVYLSYVQGAVYNALVAIEGGYAPYNSAQPAASPTASREAAVATAAYDVLVHYFPAQQAMLAGRYATSLQTIANGPDKDAGIAVGHAVAQEMILARSGDVLMGLGGYTVPTPGPGVWEPTAPAPPIDPWMRQLQPFLRSSITQYRPPSFDRLATMAGPQYAADFNEVKDLGAAMSTSRTPEQTEVARFWSTNMVVQSNAAYRWLAAERSLNLIDTARMMAMGNMVASDSLIFTFDTKYEYNFWRPVTAIQRADTDGNDATAPVPGWMPLLMTPNFPEYVAGHGSFVSAQAEVFTNLFGTDFNVPLGSSVTNTVRRFANATDLRTEIVNARTWGGLHFRSSTVLGVDLGQQLVQDALATFFNAAPDRSTHVAASGGIRKFVDGLPGLGAGAANNLGQYIPVAVPDTTTFPGSDYYIIELGEYTEQLHSDLPPTTLRGYRQAGGVYNYLGPAIVAQKDRPVRILFRNLLPTGAGGNLFVPVDSTVMGSGMTPKAHEMGDHGMADPQVPMCNEPDPMMKAMMVAEGLCFAENRATLHLHGGVTPWISDGTPHQWITPAGQATDYPEGVSVVDVPDMPVPAPGEMTFFYSNQQSARLMFYHDHAWGITRLNVYAGEAAPYIIQDATEQALVNAQIIPGADATIPLVIQDKTFVPGPIQLAGQDETWDVANWGGEGSLWVPHVYSPAQNPGDFSGVNQYGRWAYGPWFWPPTSNVENGPIPNPYFDPACDPDATWCEPQLMPGVPYNSMGMESFNDTPVVNGTAYPTLTVDPKAYRFRILNAANDRFFNLSLYQAIDANGVLCDANNPNPAPESTGVPCTEVALNPDEVAAALDDPTVFPTPLTGTEGPDWIAIGTEGGFLPAPVEIPAHPTTWVNDPTVFNAGNVDLHSLLTAPAERHDVIVDFSRFAGQTLILYNDAPAAFPARDPRYDYYTGNGDYRDTGGASSTLPGYGPNTRTVMQIKVAAAAPAPAFDLGRLQNAFKSTSLGGFGVFENGQHPIIVGQGEYNSAYGTQFTTNGANNGTVQIYDTALTFNRLIDPDVATAPGAPYQTSTPAQMLTVNLKPKMIQDEMGEAFEHEYGRMSGFLGVETPNAQAGLQNMILHGYTYPPDEILDAVELPPGVKVTPIATTDDGTQIWKFTHNGVDTHPIHFHLYDVQLLNRVGWDGIVRKPDANELGWKDTVRISPLEDTIVAMRPLTPQIPVAWGGLPNSIRLLDPSMPEGMFLEGANTSQREAAGLPLFAFNPAGEPVDITNHKVNFGWEYVYHCHILSHEEMDMMHAQVVGVSPAAPSNLTSSFVGGNPRAQRGFNLEWTDNSKNETAWVIERRLQGSTGPYAVRATVPVGATGPTRGQFTWKDTTGNNTQYQYQVYAINVVGDSWDYSNPAFNNIPPGGGWPTLVLDSRGGSVSALATPTIQTASVANKNGKTALVTLTWTDTSNGEAGFLIQRAQSPGFQFNVVNTTVEANITTVTVEVPRGATYDFRMLAFNNTIQSAWSNTVTRSAP